MKTKLEQKLIQKQAPATLQLITMLQMNSLEFQNYIEKTIEENPVFDFEPPQIFDLGYKFVGKGRRTDTTDIDPLTLIKTQPAVTSLYEDICMQLDSSRNGVGAVRAVKLMARHLDSRGYLAEQDYSVFASDMGEDKALKALKLLQSLSPAGIGARSLAECLCLQLERMPECSSLCTEIAAKHLELMSKGHFKQIAKLCNASVNEVQQACQIIRSLDPKPARGFETQDRAEYVLPDFMLEEDGRLLLGQSYSPKLSLSTYYRDMLNDEAAPEIKEYLEQKFRQAEQLITNIEKRNHTAFKCMQAIMEKQRSFFEGRGKNPLKPLTHADIAELTGYSESTISRVVNGKYIQCSFGTYPLSYFFSAALTRGEQSVSSDDARGRISELVEHEDKSAPLSDQDIVELLVKEGIGISRRTVAKYRQQLGIPGTYARKI